MCRLRSGSLRHSAMTASTRELVLDDDLLLDDDDSCFTASRNFGCSTLVSRQSGISRKKSLISEVKSNIVKLPKL